MGGDTDEWDRIMLIINQAEKRVVQVGVLAADGGAEDHDGISMVELAAIHEFGAPAAGIPERSYIRETFFVIRKDDLVELQTKILRRILEGRLTIDQGLNILGQQCVAWVKDSISSRKIKQDLKPETIQRKNRTAADKSDATTALVNTGRLINAITYRVVPNDALVSG